MSHDDDEILYVYVLIDVDASRADVIYPVICTVSAVRLAKSASAGTGARNYGCTRENAGTRAYGAVIAYCAFPFR